ncbi:hypothetical protein [Thalassospira sp.]|uniref:hypothetical protein n=1 Tax=Thalassospira sp. TaxID=1912094 RepID=UPI0027344DAA|nr:hypothetical protein [Thalassospira sp.]MDP2699569.1 hypothetical protein [Thalassospira sp.]
MPDTYSARPLTDKTAEMTYPLVQMMQSGLTQEDWRKFVDSYSDVEIEKTNARQRLRDPWLRRQGIIVVCNERGYVHGLFSYEIRRDIGGGPVLHVDNVIAVEIVARGYALSAMRRAMTRLVELHDCKAVHVALSDTDSKLKSYFTDAGFVAQKTRYCASVSRP